MGPPTECCVDGGYRLGCQRGMVGTGWANPHPSYLNRLIKLSSCRRLILAGTAVMALSGQLLTTNADYCMYSLMSGHG